MTVYVKIFVAVISSLLFCALVLYYLPGQFAPVKSTTKFCYVDDETRVPVPVELVHTENWSSTNGYSVGLVLAEARKKPYLSHTIISFLLFTPRHWPLYIVCPSLEKDPSFIPWVQSLPALAVAKNQERPVIFKKMFDKCVGSNGNCAVLETEYWDMFAEDYLVIFQYDTALCNRPDHSVTDFVGKYDHIGSPWIHNPGHQGINLRVGNGGFSLRNRTFLQHCIKRAQTNDGIRLEQPEDLFFSYCAHKFGRLASLDEAKKWGVETMVSHENIGFHISNFRACDNKEHHQKWKDDCPQAAFLFNTKMMHGRDC